MDDLTTSDNQELTIGPFLIMGNGVVCLRDPTAEDIETLYAVGDRWEERATWMKAYALRFAREQFGKEEMWNLSFGAIDRSYAYNLMWVARWWSPEYIVEGVPLSFHQVLTPRMAIAIVNNDAEGIEIARQWLIDAREMEMGKRELMLDVRDNTLPPSMRGENFRPTDAEPIKVYNPAERFAKALRRVPELREFLVSAGRDDLLDALNEINAALEAAEKAAGIGHLNQLKSILIDKPELED